MTGRILKNVLIFAVASLIFLIIYNSNNDNDSYMKDASPSSSSVVSSNQSSSGSSSNNSNSSRPATEFDKWYEGGTLHRKTISDWKKAENRDKLATCADFIASIKDKLNLSITSVDSIKPYAEDLVICIDIAVKDIDTMDNDKVTEVAALSMVLMGWVK